jgi:hypothetical protein
VSHDTDMINVVQDSEVISLDKLPHKAFYLCNSRLRRFSRDYQRPKSVDRARTTKSRFDELAKENVQALPVCLRS